MPLSVTPARFKSRFSAVLQIYLSAEGRGCLAEGHGKLTVQLRAVNTASSRSSRYICGFRRLEPHKWESGLTERDPAFLQRFADALIINGETINNQKFADDAHLTRQMCLENL